MNLKPFCQVMLRKKREYTLHILSGAGKSGISAGYNGICVGKNQ